MTSHFVSPIPMKKKQIKKSLLLQMDALEVLLLTCSNIILKIIGVEITFRLVDVGNA